MASGRFSLYARCAFGRNHVLKTFGAALLLASGLAITAGPALALQTVVKPVAGGAQINGFTATTRVSGMVQDESPRWSRARHRLPKAPPQERQVPLPWGPSKRSSALFRRQASLPM
jgi:hypothetical protein